MARWPCVHRDGGGGRIDVACGIPACGRPGGTLDVADIAASIAESPARNLIVGLLLGGFGIKAGAVPLHAWLPLAHPVAPTPASAALSGCMIKAGLLGWLRFLPLGLVSMPEWGSIVVAGGLAAAFFGVVAGLTQKDPKTTLAYSSISQIGLINVSIGVGLMEPATWPMAMVACPVYAMHHGLAKGALFLGVGVAGSTAAAAWPRRLLTAGLAWPALALAGAPLTSGWVAKAALKEATVMAPPFWYQSLDVLLPVAAVGTTVLMWRFLAIVLQPPKHRMHGTPPGLWLPWTLLVAAGAAVVWVVPGLYGFEVVGHSLVQPRSIWVALWPPIAGTALYLSRATWMRWLGVRRQVSIAAGDFVVPIERALRGWRGYTRVAGTGDPVASLASTWYGLFTESRPRDPMGNAEMKLTRWSAAGLLLLLLIAALFGLFVFG
jgi:formate hydrogenlyase subunit 3/multisubunit Na+/H+ antiporter MnhD subunit